MAKSLGKGVNLVLPDAKKKRRENKNKLKGEGKEAGGTNYM